MSHTPGPWFWDEDYHGLFGAGPDNAVLTWYAYEGMHLSYGDRREANARLIAAAPDMLEALKIAQQFISIASDWNLDEAHINGQTRSTYEWLYTVAAAIAKATGETT
jgi:hypothetical protein